MEEGHDQEADELIGGVDGQELEFEGFAAKNFSC